MKLVKNIILIISILALSFQIYMDVEPSLGLSIEGRVIIVLIQVLGFISIYWYYRNKVTIEKRKRYFKLLMWMLFVIYLLNLFYLLFLDGEMGRNLHAIENMDMNLLFGVNFVPLRTIKLFVKSYYQGYLPLSIITINLIGNILAFMPLAIFLQTLFKSQRKSSVYFITASLLIIGVEILQVLTMSGSGDIDDYILNVVGSMLIYFIVKLYRKVKKL